MGIEKLLQNLNEYLDQGEKKNRVKCDRIDDLLVQLKKKKGSLKRKLEKEKSASKQKRLKTDLKIIELQLKKGAKRRDELAKKCK
ncbi:MAG: hypothetical protein ABW168_18135 [Sedimenticola sp.]